MKLSKTPHVTEISLGTALEGQLCPAMRRFPNLGSLVAELAVAAVELFRKILDLSLGLPGMIHIWQSNRVGCSLVTRFVLLPFLPCAFFLHSLDIWLMRCRGHTLLKNCGSELFSLNDFFDALNRANAHFWRSFAIVAERIRSLDNYQLANVVDGVAYYGEATLTPLSAYSSIVTSTRIPTDSMGKQIIQVALFFCPVSWEHELIMLIGEAERFPHGRPCPGKPAGHLGQPVAGGPVFLQSGGQHRQQHHPACHAGYPELRGHRGSQGDPCHAQQQALPSKGCLLRLRDAGHDPGMQWGVPHAWLQQPVGAVAAQAVRGDPGGHPGSLRFGHVHAGGRAICQVHLRGCFQGGCQLQPVLPLYISHAMFILQI